MTQLSLFGQPELPPETAVAIDCLPSNEALGPVDPDAEFCRSIVEFGVLNPICLRRQKKGYEVVEGKRRIKAARKCGMRTVPCRVFPQGWADADIIQIALHENRKPNLLSELEAFESALESQSVEDIKRRAGLRQSKIRVLTQLQNLIPELRKALGEGKLKPSAAAIACKMPKTYQKKLLSPLKHNGKIKVKDIQEVQLARRNSTVAELPAYLFESDEDWKSAALSKVNDLRSIFSSHGQQFQEELSQLEKKIKES